MKTFFGFRTLGSTILVVTLLVPFMNGIVSSSVAQAASIFIFQKGQGSAQSVVFPDVGKTPSPGGPIPIPYPNATAFG